MVSTARSDASSFLALNQSELAELVTFVDFAEGLTIAFVEINFAPDADVLLEALQQHPTCEAMRFQVLNFSNQPDLRFLRDEIVQRLNPIKVPADQKLVVVVRGLEAAIGTDNIGSYPPMLRDLNFVRDAYRTSVPHPILFVLPDYAITRVAKYAPDFWAWRSGVFTFKASAQTRETLRTEALDAPTQRIASEENQEQIDRLKQLLMVYHPSTQPMIAPENLEICSDLYYRLGTAYLTQKQPTRARDYLKEALKLATRREDTALQQSTYRALGDAFEQARQFEEAIESYTQSLQLAKLEDNQRQIATALFDLGNVALAQRQFQSARHYYQQCLEIEQQQNDRYSQASTYHQLGIVDQELREYESARRHYQQALDLFIEFGDRYEQAGTYAQLGLLAEALEELPEAQTNLLQALQIFAEYQDQHLVGAVMQNLARIYRTTQDPELIAAVAQILGCTVEEAQGAIEQLGKA